MFRVGLSVFLICGPAPIEPGCSSGGFVRIPLQRPGAVECTVLGSAHGKDYFNKVRRVLYALLSTTGKYRVPPKQRSQNPYLIRV